MFASTHLDLYRYRPTDLYYIMNYDFFVENGSHFEIQYGRHCFLCIANANLPFNSLHFINRPINQDPFSKSAMLINIDSIKHIMIAAILVCM